ncbi:hypothetical protein CJ195_19555 [Bacillus sp. UMB0899]|nr:hypothetical protein CJ195_19555 [Bacillus sp. UMB0899]
MKRGVVVELDDDFVTLLTPDGQFLRTLNKEGNYELGEEISFFPLADKREEAATRTKRAGNRILFNHLRTRTARIGALSAVAIIFFMISFLPFLNNDKVYAYMSIDINPSFEVSLDNHLKVISLVPLNDEANNIMDSLANWQEKPLNEIVQVIINECKSDGYVYPGKEIVITTVMNETDKKIEQQLEENLTKISSTVEEEEMIVKTMESDKETREKAQKQGVSTGKYLELVEQQVESKEKDDSTQSDATLVPIVPEKKETNTNTSSQVKEQTNTKPVNNNSVQRELKSETKEKLDKAKQKIKENAQKNQHKRNENIQNNNKQTVRVKQEERKENRNERNREWNSKKDRDNENDQDHWNEDRDNDKNGRKEYNRGKNNNGGHNKEDRKQAKNDREDD